ncbi:uncharacterized protein BdWA1_003724 [Babesia duncani]|uniref:Uncharacterized protein n=1 Tax=Babesia duncani TaxID=323732 RepID=A0AAD9PH84_9APIC|nr:hypothetical protein BdWA1_003724 [Babesia duncani]
MKAAYRQAVGMFGGENCRKVYNCFPRLSEYNVGYNCARSPSSLRLGSLDEVKEALRLKISSCQGLGDETACVTWFDPISLDELLRGGLDRYQCMLPLVQQFCWLNLRIHWRQ